MSHSSSALLPLTVTLSNSFPLPGKLLPRSHCFLEGDMMLSNLKMITFPWGQLIQPQTHESLWVPLMNVRLLWRQDLILVLLWPKTMVSMKLNCLLTVTQWICEPWFQFRETAPKWFPSVSPYCQFCIQSTNYHENILKRWNNGPMVLGPPSYQAPGLVPRIARMVPRKGTRDPGRPW